MTTRASILDWMYAEFTGYIPQGDGLTPHRSARVTDKIQQQNASQQVRVVEGILRRWDPIGVQPGRFAPADEYDSYAPQIVSMVASGCSPDALAAHLEDLSIQTMGVGSNLRASTKFAAEIIRTLQSPDPVRK